MGGDRRGYPFDDCFGGSAGDDEFTIENTRTGAAVRVRGDHPLSEFHFYAAPLAVCPEPFVRLELQPGQMSLHDVYMVHGAKANRSKRRRTGVALRYMPSASVFERRLRPAEGKTGLAVDFANRPLWLVRGIDRSGRNDFAVGHKR